jgi:hypothetical protein
VKKNWKALHFTMHILKNGNSNINVLAFTSLVRPILEYGAACSDPYRKGQINVLGWMQNIADTFAHYRNDLNRETLTENRKIARIYALFKAYTGERASKAIGDRLQTPCYLNRVDHDRASGSKKHKRHIGKYSFVNRTIQLWNQLPAVALGTFSCKPSNFRKMVRKVITKGK